MPESVRPAVRRCIYFVPNVWDAIRGRVDPLVPERGLRFVGSGDYRQVGREFLGHFRTHAGLSPDESVLDVGSGNGRMAVALLNYLSDAGRYEGFDVVGEGVEWSRRVLTARRGNFRFRRADVHNRLYNPAGRHAACRYRFPYDDATFDFAFATSVFTHMLAEEVDNYLRQIARVLRPGGRCLLTFFLINDESRRLMAEGRSELAFGHRLGRCLVQSVRKPHAAVAYEESDVRNMLDDAGLRLRDPVLFGRWCARARWVGYQDMVVADRPG
jgi:SAM-dependent methyltransferase